MKVYTYSHACQTFTKLLDDTRGEGQVQIKRRDGFTFVVKPVNENKSLLDIEGVHTTLSLSELNKTVRYGRQRF